MPLYQLIVIAVVQGITEFLPISSSGHLYLTSNLLGWVDQGVRIDAAVHLGTLVAVLIWCWRDIASMVGGFFLGLVGRRSEGGRLLLLLVVGTIPLIVVGALLVHFERTDMFRSLAVVGWATIGFGILLWIADHFGMTVRRLEHMGVAGAVIVGLFQIVATIPGASRAGMTMTAARILGFERVEAARFSLLLSIPAILAAGGHAVLTIVEDGDATLTTDVFIAIGLACITALPTIALMMAWLRRAGYGPFVAYRIVLGALLLAVAYGLV